MPAIPPPKTPPAQVLILSGADLWMDDGTKAGVKAGLALALQKGLIVGIAPAPKLARRYPRAKRVDLPGGTLLPGLIEGHVHVGEYASLFRDADLQGLASLEDAQAKLRFWAAAHPAGWVRGRGWDQNLWPSKAFPTAADLEAVAGGRPACLDRVDGHAIWVNYAALKLAGITKETPDPAGGRILRDAAGEPTGVLLDEAKSLVTDRIPLPSQVETEALLLDGMERLRAFGFTAVTDIDISLPELRAYRALQARGRLPLRVFAYLSTAKPGWEAELGPKRYEGMFQLMGAKFYMDGALGSRGARLLEPYADAPESRGLWVTAPATVARGVEFTFDRGYQPAIHAIGDAANRAALDLLERLISTHPAVPSPRIEHAQILADEDVRRFMRWRIIASMQPVHCTSDHAWTPARLGPARQHEAYRWRDLLNGGAMLAFGSDAPNDLASPWEGLASAETRSDAKGDPPGGWLPEQRLTRPEALRAYTMGNAQALNRPELGWIIPGASADLIWIQAPILSLTTEQLRAQSPGHIWIAGQEVPTRDPGATP